jgi:hypothetical protein
MKKLHKLSQIQRIIWLIPVLAITFIGVQCSKIKNTTPPKTELEKLPPITQTGANTFGCLVNGVAWLPNGTKPGIGGGSNIQVYVDPTFQGGMFGISGHKYKDGPFNKVGFSANPCIGAGQYFTNSSILIYDYSKAFGNTICEITTNEQLTTVKYGALNITKYDLTNRIFSGTFEATLYNATTCTDTIKITNGRFDVKL